MSSINIDPALLDEEVRARYEADKLAFNARSAQWDTEKRDDDISYGDLGDLLQEACCDKFCTGYDGYLWICDFSQSWVVYCMNGNKFQCTYTFDGVTVVLSEPVQVTDHTQWVPVQSNSNELKEVEQRDKPTIEDVDVMKNLLAAKVALDAAKAAQMTDPDNATDPDDAKVMTNLHAAEEAITAAIASQAIDGNHDAVAPKENKSSTLHAVPKRSFTTLTERSVPTVASISVRADDAIDPTATGVPFTGYASVTGVAYEVRDWMGLYNETIQPGAFAKTLREQSAIPLLQNHNPDLVLASTSSGTSTLAEDKSGLRNDASINREYRQLLESMRRGDVNKMSFSFRAIKDKWDSAYEDRSVTELACYDTSIVTYPASTATTAELLDEFRSTMGREGIALAWSIRSAIGTNGLIDQAAEPLLENAIRAIAGVDEILTRRSSSYALQGRARTFAVAGLIEELRVGKPVSAANMKLVTSAMDALADASVAHERLSAAHSAAASALTELSGNAAPKQGSSADDATSETGETDTGAPATGGNASGLDNDSGGAGGAGNAGPAAEGGIPADGLGVRSKTARAQELDLLRLRSGR